MNARPAAGRALGSAQLRAWPEHAADGGRGDNKRATLAGRAASHHSPRPRPGAACARDRRPRTPADRRRAAGSRRTASACRGGRRSTTPTTRPTPASWGPSPAGPASCSSRRPPAPCRDNAPMVTSLSRPCHVPVTSLSRHFPVTALSHPGGHVPVTSRWCSCPRPGGVRVTSVSRSCHVPVASHPPLRVESFASCGHIP